MCKAVYKGEIKIDLFLSLESLLAYSGVSFWQEDLHLEAELQVHSDAAGSSGFSVYFRGHWCAQEWPHEWAEKG